MRRLLCLTLLFLCIRFCQAQPAAINYNALDSLTRIALARNSKPLPPINRDSLLRQLPFTQSANARIQIMYDILNYHGKLDVQQNLRYINQILEISKKDHDEIGQALMTGEIAYITGQNGDNALATKYYLQALKLAQLSGNDQALGIVYTGMAFLNRRHTPTLKSYLLKAAHFSSKGGSTPFLCSDLSHLAMVYRLEGKPDSAWSYISKAFKLAVENNSRESISFCLFEIGFQQKSISRKLQYYQAALHIPFDQYSRMFALTAIAEAYKENHQTDSSLVYARKAYLLTKPLYWSSQIGPVALLADLYTKLNADSALKYTRLQMEVQDSLNNSSNMLRGQLLVEADQQRQQELQRSASEYRDRVRLYSVIAALLVVMLFVVVLWVANKKQRRANQQLKEQKKLIEAQAREAQIEAALERVRSKTMAMRKSKELREVIQLILDQLLELDFSIDTASFGVEISSNDLKNWLAAPGQQYATRFDIPYIDHPVFNRLAEAKEKGESLVTFLLSKEDKDRFYDYYFKFIPISEERKSYIYDSIGWASSSALFDTVILNIITLSAVPYSNEQNQILVRFGKAFEQTYTRFLDMQKAEAQAKEAQIEAALERVRSRSMAMQKSEELKEIIQVIFDQLDGLDFNLDTASFVVEIDKTNDLRNWVASRLAQYPTRIDLPYIDHPIFNMLVEAKEQGKDFITFLLDKEEKDQFFDHYFQFTATSEERKTYIYNAKSWVGSCVLFEKIMLSIYNYSGISFSNEENETLVRFGKAFEQTYTRFLDLQKAEHNAKEALRQASVDRVRAEIASMRTTKDLDRIIPLIWNELTILHIPFTRCGVFIIDEMSQQTQVYLSDPEGKAIAAFQMPFDSKVLNDEVLQHWHENEVLKYHWDAAAFSAWTYGLVEAGAIQPDENYSTEEPPENLHLHFIPFMQGMLYVGNTEPLSADELSLIESLADAFATAYARYEDFNKLETAKQQIETTLTALKATQSQLIQAEKMASLGELTAGIAHEIQNPLNFVNNFAEVSVELLSELKDEADAGNKQDVLAIADDLAQNLEKISFHGKRADGIVKGMLQHSRASSGQKEPTNINVLADEYLRLAYHGLRAKDKTFNTGLITHFDDKLPLVNIVPQDIGRVLLNLFTNAFYAVQQKAKTAGQDYKPTVEVNTATENNHLIISVKDNGIGIPEHIKDKIMQPFFTTKPTGEGTGLGLSLSYDIVVKGHGGSIDIQSKEGEGSEFIVRLPVMDHYA